MVDQVTTHLVVIRVTIVHLQVSQIQDRHQVSQIQDRLLAMEVSALIVMERKKVLEVLTTIDHLQTDLLLLQLALLIVLIMVTIHKSRLTDLHQDL